MSIIRIHHDRKNFTLLSNEVLRDKTISNAARGLWAQCMSRTEGWEFHISEILKNTTDRKTKIYTQIKELINAGYVARIQIYKRAANGKFLFHKLDYVFFESKITEEKKADFLEEFRKTFPHSDFLNTENQDPEKRPLINTNNSNTDSQEEQQQPEEKPRPKEKEPDNPKPNPKPSAVAAVFSCLKDLDIKQSEKEWITRHYTEDIVINAVRFAMHPDTKLTKPLAAAIKWACKEKPDLPVPKDDLVQYNRSKATEMAKKTILPKTSYIEVLNKHVELGFTSGQAIPTTISYDDKNFATKLEEAIKKYGGKMK